MSDPARSADTIPNDRFVNEVMMLGGIMGSGDPAAVRAVAAICGPEHLSDWFNARLFARIVEGVDAGLDRFKLIHWLIGRLRDDDTLRQAGTTASAIVARYVAAAAPPIGLEGCARQIRHDWLNDLLNVAVADGDTPAAEACAAEMQRLSAAHLVKDEGLESIGTLSDRIINSLNDAYQAGEIVKDYADCGLLDLRYTITGWRRGRFYVVAGRPGMGKSTFAMSALLRTAMAGHGVLMFALEMGRQELTEMALADLAWSSTARVEYRDLSATAVMREGFERKFEIVLQVAPTLNSLPFMIGDRGGLTIPEIRSQAMQYSQKLQSQGRRLDVICIDHLGLIKASSSYAGNKVAETEEISSALKALAKELGCAVIALAQLNRGVEGRDDKRPTLSDLRWSGSIEQDADVVMMVYREAYYLERAKSDDMAAEHDREARLARCRNKLEVAVVKHRGGPCRTLEFYCDMGCAAVRDMDNRHG